MRAIKNKNPLFIFSTSIYKLFSHKMSHLTLKQLYEVVTTYFFVPVSSEILPLVQESSYGRIRAPAYGHKVVRQQDRVPG